ncbi:unnamed protein product [Rotaria sordida]|uniref:C2H2-type domain-containing protein n=1 Tax=Rotaria sordida TaxID=392033 RepID=A0A814W4P4_9BILA|nr:unnamed protein product [Rotaria sordida]CAF1467149.1 unnamed protein product [Rotaria sordida]
MTPLDWLNVSKTGTFIQHTFGALPLIGSLNDAGVLSVTSKSSSSKSCTLPSLTSTKHSRLSTPSLSSSDGKGKRPLSFSPMSDNLLMHTQQQQSIEMNLISNVQHSNHLPSRILTPLIEPNEIQCQWLGCDLLFSTPMQLTEHIRSVHINRTDSRTWLCQWPSCTRNRMPFKSLYSLFLHLRTHTQDRPYQCSHIGCTKTFTRAEYLRLHERSHTGEKPYPCEYADCSKAFSNPSDRTKHIKRTHLNKKEYICQIQGCSKSYTDPSSLRKHVKNIHGEDAFRQKKHKRTDNNNDNKQFEETKKNISNTILISNLNYPNGLNNQSNILMENNDDDDEDVIVDQGVSLNVDILGDTLGGLSVSTSTALPVHRASKTNSLKQIAKKAVLPAIHITGVCETDGDETSSNKGQQHQVAFRSVYNHRISAHSGSTAYSSMRSDSMNVDSALFLPSNHSSMISLAQHPSASPYEYDCISNDNIKYETRSNNALTIPSIQTSYSPLRCSNGSSEQLLTLPRVNSTTSHLSSILTNELSPSSSFCVSTLSGDIQQPTILNSNPKMTHLLYFLQTLEYNQHLDNEDI